MFAPTPPEALAPGAAEPAAARRAGAADDARPICSTPSRAKRAIGDAPLDDVAPPPSEKAKGKRPRSLGEELEESGGAPKQGAELTATPLSPPRRTQPANTTPVKPGRFKHTWRTAKPRSIDDVRMDAFAEMRRKDQERGFVDETYFDGCDPDKEYKGEFKRCNLCELYRYGVREVEDEFDPLKRATMLCAECRRYGWCPEAAIAASTLAASFAPLVPRKARGDDAGA